MFGTETAQRQGNAILPSSPQGGLPGTRPFGSSEGQQLRHGQCSDDGQWPWENISFGKASAIALQANAGHLQLQKRDRLAWEFL